MKLKRPKKISVRPGNHLEGDVVIVWVYHRKVQIQLAFPWQGYPDQVSGYIDEAVAAWEHAMKKMEG